MSALKAIKKFRVNEIVNLPRFITRSGPLVVEKKLKGAVDMPNPFLPQKNTNTGRWAPPKFSLRRQKEMVKKAKESKMLHLLPPGPKFKPDKWQRAAKAFASSAEEPWAMRVNWVGKMKEKTQVVDGGVRLYGTKKRMFKGHRHERIKPKRMARRHDLLRDMPDRIAAYKSYHRRRMPPPLAIPKVTNYTKLPF